jgi:hypothetical protein
MYPHQARIEELLKAADKLYLDEIVKECVNKKGEFVREGPAGMSEAVYAHWKAKEDRRKEREESMRNCDLCNTDDPNSSKFCDFLASLHCWENGEFKKEGAPEWLQDYCTAKDEKERQRQRKKEHQKKEHQKKLEYLKKQTKKPPRRDLKARLAEIAAMNNIQLAGGGNDNKTIVKETGVEINEVENTEGKSTTAEKKTGEDNVTEKTKKKGILRLPRATGGGCARMKRTVRFTH